MYYNLVYIYDVQKNMLYPNAYLLFINFTKLNKFLFITYLGYNNNL